MSTFQRGSVIPGKDALHTQTHVFRVEGPSTIKALRAGGLENSDIALVSPRGLGWGGINSNQVEFKPIHLAHSTSNNVLTCVATFKPGAGENPDSTIYGLKPSVAEKFDTQENKQIFSPFS